MLEARGDCDVVGATTAATATANIATGTFDLIVCDASIDSRDDGFAVLAYASSVSPRSLRVLLSGRELPKDRMTDVERFVLKPLVRAELTALIEWARATVRR